LHNFQSQGMGTSANPAPSMFVDACSLVGFLGMVNPKAALDSKAAMTPIRPIQCPGVAPLRAQYAVPKAYTKHILCPFVCYLPWDC